MGAFFTNVSLKTSDLDSVKTALGDEAAFVSTGQNWITVYSQKIEDEDDTSLIEFAKKLSQNLSASAIVFTVYDSDTLAYFFCRNGELIDQYNDHPEEPVEGKPESLVEITPEGTTVEQITKVLTDHYTFAEEKLTALAKVLGIDTVESVGYKYLVDEINQHPNIKPLT